METIQRKYAPKKSARNSRERYRDMKERLREAAIDWQHNLELGAQPSYSEMAKAQRFFTEMGMKYGLTIEFRENGII